MSEPIVRFGVITAVDSSSFVIDGRVFARINSHYFKIPKGKDAPPITQSSVGKKVRFEAVEKFNRFYNTQYECKWVEFAPTDYVDKKREAEFCFPDTIGQPAKHAAQQNPSNPASSQPQTVSALAPSSPAPQEIPAAQQTPSNPAQPSPARQEKPSTPKLSKPLKMPEQTFTLRCLNRAKELTLPFNTPMLAIVKQGPGGGNGLVPCLNGKVLKPAQTLGDLAVLHAGPQPLIIDLIPKGHPDVRDQLNTTAPAAPPSSSAPLPQPATQPPPNAAPEPPTLKVGMRYQNSIIRILAPPNITLAQLLKDKGPQSSDPLAACIGHEFLEPSHLLSSFKKTGDVLLIDLFQDADD